MKKTVKLIFLSCLLSFPSFPISLTHQEASDYPETFILRLDYREYRNWNIKGEPGIMKGRREYSLSVRAECKLKETGLSYLYESKDAYIVCKDIFSGTVQGLDFPDERGNWSGHKSGTVPLKCRLRFRPRKKTYGVNVHQLLPDAQMEYNFDLWSSHNGRCKGTGSAPDYLPHLPIEPVSYEEKQSVFTHDESWTDIGPDVSPSIHAGCPDRGPVMVQTPVIIHPFADLYHKTVNWTIKAPKYEVEITTPKEEEEFVYGRVKAKELDVDCIAKAIPQIFEEDIHPWRMDPIQGAERELIKRDKKTGRLLDTKPVKGPFVQFHHEGLPEDNNEFGHKTITADIAEPVRVKVFFEKGGFPAWKKDNPEGKDPDWFYYWKQGAVPGLDECVYAQNLGNCYGQYVHSSGTIKIGPPAATEQSSLNLILTIRSGGGTRQRVIKIPALKGVDVCHATVLHEMKHKEIYEKFYDKITRGEWTDTDGDILPDWWEDLYYAKYGFDSSLSDTHSVSQKFGYPGYAKIGDQEILAREAECQHSANHDQDWANPGKQSKEKY